MLPPLLHWPQGFNSIFLSQCCVLFNFDLDFITLDTWNRKNIDPYTTFKYADDLSLYADVHSIAF